MTNGSIAQIAALLLVVGVVAFGGGYIIAGGPEKLAQQYTIGENIDVRVVVYDSDSSVIENKVVGLNSGMTVLDAVANVYEIMTDLTWPQYGPAVKTLDDRWFDLKVNGETPNVGFAAIQLKGDENIELSIL